MFARLPDAAGQRVVIDIVIDGARVAAHAGDTVAAAMLAAGVGHCRTTPVHGAPRAPFCMMGACFDCLVTVDDVPSQQACRITVAPGMRIATQLGARAIENAGNPT